MNEKSIQFSYKELENWSLLDADTQKLVSDTIAFSANAYAPYSNFNVSALAELESGEVVKGTNVENASYPVGVCAERNLISHITSNYPKGVIKRIFIYVDHESDQPVPPCGICRQSLVEKETNQNSPIELYLIAKNNKTIIINHCRDLLPLTFDSEFLKS